MDKTMNAVSDGSVGRSQSIGSGSLSGKSLGERSTSSKDKIDLKNMDAQLERLLSHRVWSTNENECSKYKIEMNDMDAQLERLLSHRVWSTNNLRESWEIDPSKLEIRDLIAQGTSKTVYRGTYNNQDVAVKLLDWGEDDMSTATQNVAFLESFEQEVAVWNKLDHPNVTRFIGASMGTSQLKIPNRNPSEGYTNVPSRAYCVVVEFLPGGTLKNQLYQNRKKKLDFKVVIQLALDLARGLSYLHSKKIMHCDVKAENMLLDENMSLKIANFGVAHVEAQNPGDMTGVTRTSLGYMAPEVLDGKPYDRKCDVYSFGICLWEIYCCGILYMDLEASSAGVKQNLRPDIPRCCPKPFSSIIKMCWDSNPKERPEMDQVVRLLEAIDTSKGGGMIPEDQAGGCCICFAPTRRP